MALPLKNLSISKTLSVKFNWESNIPTRTIEDTVLVSLVKEDQEVKVEDINEIIDVSRTVDFEQPEHCTEKPTLTFTLSDYEQLYISRIFIVCDCMIIEVFGDHLMYTDTVHGTLVEECDNFRACEFKVDVNKKENKQVTISFLRLNSEKRLWIYGLQLTLKPLSPKVNASSIRYDNVEELIRGVPLSEKAATCFNFMKHFTGTSQFNAPPTQMNSSNDSNTDKVIQEMKLYIDHKFQVLTELLILRERNLHDKIDLILNHIKSQRNSPP